MTKRKGALDSWKLYTPAVPDTLDGLLEGVFE